MARRIRIIGASLCVIVFIVAFIMVCVVGSSSVSNIKGVKIGDIIDTSVSLKWKSVSNADGYEIYAKSADNNEYTLVKLVEDKDASETTVEGLNPNTYYDFYIVGYRGADSKKHISKKQAAFFAQTLPQQPKIVVDSVEKGELKITWDEIKNVAGYEICYAGKDDKNTDVIEQSTTTSKMYNGKPSNVSYSVKVRSFVYKDNEKVYSPWSKVSKVAIADRQVQSNTIDPNKPMIALTFDDGPDYNDVSDRIVDVLEKYNAKATFFMLGRNAASNKANLKRKIDLGMEIGNHTYDHEHYGANVTASDIKKSSDAIYNACGVYPTAFRSPGGITTSVIRDECRAENMPLYYWNLDTQDWKSRDANKVYNMVMKYVEDGDIILMHEIYGSTAEAVEKMVPELIKQGYQLVTCSDLIKYKGGKDAEPGTQYVNYNTVRNETN